LGGTIADWIGAGSSGVAVIVSVVVAWLVGRQSKSIAADQLRQQREAYVVSRMQELVGHARAVVLESKTVWNLTNSRFRAELLNIEPENDGARASRQERIADALTRLETEVSLLRAYAVTMPSLLQRDPASAAVRRLQDEGTWLSSAAHFAAFTHFDDPSLWPADSVFEDLVSGQLENVDRRLLAGLPDGMNLDNVPFFSEPGSPWPPLLQQRRAILTQSQSSLASEPMAVAANLAMLPVLDRFQDELIHVLREWNRAAD
jgi:hypothetical protein